MAPAFTPEHDELRRTVRAFLAKHAPEAEVSRLMATEEGYDPIVWQRMADMGLLGLAVPESLGGSGYGWIEVGIVLEEAGRSLLCAPYYSTVVLAVGALLASGDENAQKEHLPDIVSGACTATLAVTGDTGRWDDPGVDVSASPHRGGWRLDGHASYVVDGATADLVLVLARTSGGLSLFAVGRPCTGMRRTPLPTLDLTRKQARLEFDAAPAVLVGPEGSGGNVARRVLDLAATGLAAEQVGGAARTLEMAVEYAKVRHQFGRPIGSFQAVKHLCADMLVEVESARSAAYHAIWAADHDPAELPVAASLAKAYCSDAYRIVAGHNIQVHGGIGFTWEHPAHLYLKRAKTDQLLFGDALHHRRLLAERIGLP
jgi:alkylation response protein AidB-like acyl-CoA dehydrogenase